MKARGISLFLATALPALAEVTLPFTLDPAASSLTTTLCVQDQCDSDTHPLEGAVVLSLDCARPPTAAALRDLRLRSPSPHQVALDFGFGGKVSAVLSNLVILHAAPSVHTPFESITNGTVTFRKIPSRLAGSVNYSASGLACVLVQISGLTCDGLIDLSQRSTNFIAELPVTLEITAGTAGISGRFDFKTLISESDPGLGEVRGHAEFKAAADFRPTVTIDLGATTHQLRWCRLFEGFHLERTTSVGPAWQAVATPPEVEGEEWVVALPNEPATWFYRLAGPGGSAPLRR